MSAAIKYSAEVVWGSSSAGTTEIGQIISCNRKSTAKQHEEPDESGELHSLVIYDQREEVTVEILAGATAAPPAIGDTFNMGGVTALIVTEAEVVWKRGDTKKINITAWKSVA